MRHRDMAKHFVDDNQWVGDSYGQTQGRRSQLHLRLVLLVVFAVLVLLALAVWCGVAIHFMGVFYPNTTVNGFDVSSMSVEEAGELLSQSFEGFSVTVTGDGVDLVLTDSDLSLKDNGTDQAEAAFDEQDPWAWPFELAKTHVLTAASRPTFDQQTIASELQALVDEGTAEAESLGAEAISFDPDTCTYFVSSDNEIQYLDVAAATSLIAQAIYDRTTEVVLKDDLLSGDSAAQAAADVANTYVGATQKLTLNGETVREVTSEMISGWTGIADDLTVTLDSAAILEWCHGELSDQLDTLGTTRTYTRPDGKVVTVTGGIYGWSIDGESTGNAIIEAIVTGTPSTIEIPCFSTAAQVPTEGNVDFGNRYVDVDITEQHARFYDDGVLIWEGDVVTGQPNLGYDTPEGVWKLNNKESGEIPLTGWIDEETGEPEWESVVNFWMPIVNNLVGIHNAPWRIAFGGDIYTYAGSHGCINLSYERAQALYNLIEIGDVVIVHY